VLTEKQLATTLSALNKAGSIRGAAKILGIQRSTVRDRQRRLAELGMLGTDGVLPGYRIKSITTGPRGTSVQQVKDSGEKFAPVPGEVIKGRSILTGPDGREMARWTKTSREQSPVNYAEELKTAFADFKPAAAPVEATDGSSESLLTLIPANDWHIGLYTWGREVGVNWDLEIAEKTIGGGIDQLIDRTPRSAIGVVLGGGDLLHSDNNSNTTSRSGNPLDVDGRHSKVLEVATRLMVRTIDRSLTRHDTIVVRILPGNHDEQSAAAIAYFLLAWYRLEPRVVVDVDPSMFWWYRFGRVLLGATHGHTVKIDRMPGIMAARRAVDWGNTIHRYAHGFHLHHSAKRASEDNGVIMEIHQAPIPQDAWHSAAGYLSGASLQAITYDRQYGEVSRSRVALLDN